MSVGGEKIAVVRFECIDSTSMHARREADAGRLCDHPVVFVATRQSGGIGRFGRGWESPAGGLWMTLAWPVGAGEMESMLRGLGVRLGVACRRVVERTLSEVGSAARVELKWPNDVLVDGRKALGVLTELVANQHGRWVLVGVGVNVNVEVTELPDPVRETACSLRGVVGRELALDRVREVLVSELEHALRNRGLDDATLEEARAHLHGVGRETTLTMPNGERLRGRMIGLEDDGRGVFEVGAERRRVVLESVVAVD